MDRLIARLDHALQQDPDNTAKQEERQTVVAKREGVQLTGARDILLQIGVDALVDGTEKTNVMLRLQLLLVDSSLGGLLRVLYERCYRHWWYGLGLNSLLLGITLLVFFDVPSAMEPAQYRELYGVLHLLLGLDVLLTAALNLVRCRPIRHQRGATPKRGVHSCTGQPRRQAQYRYNGHLGLGTFVVPGLWSLAVWQLLGSDDTDPRLWGHYTAPLILVLRNEYMWSSLSAFMWAIYYARNVVYLLLCMILVSAALSVMLFSGLV